MKWFWAVVSSFTQEELARLLQFTTGSSQLPPGGFNTLCPSFQIIAAPTHSTLPTAHTWWVGKHKQKQYGVLGLAVSVGPPLWSSFFSLNSCHLYVSLSIRLSDALKIIFEKWICFPDCPSRSAVLCVPSLCCCCIFWKCLQLPHISVLWSLDFCLYSISVCQRCERVSNEFHPCML